MELSTIIILILAVFAVILVLKFVTKIMKVVFVIALIAILIFSIVILTTNKDIKEEGLSLFEKGKDLTTGFVTKKIKEKTEINSSEESKLTKFIP